MNDLDCKHFSHKFYFNLNKLPAKGTDRFSRLILLIAIIAGLLLCLLGLFYFIPDAITGAADIEKGIPKAKSVFQPHVSPKIFNLFIILTGLGVVFFSIVNLFRCKKIFFDGDKFTVVKKTFLGKKEAFTEDLYNYVGVRLRVIFYQFGIFNKNKFIIELYHHDSQKIIPLYITTSKRHIRRIWQRYAQKLQMPAITISDKGMVSHNFQDLNLPYREVIAKWHLPAGFAYKFEKPSYISFKSRKNGDKMIRINKMFLDAMNLLSVCTIGILSALLVFAVLNHNILLAHMTPAWVWGFYTLLVLIILYALICLTIKDTIFIINNNICIFRQTLFFRINGGVIPFEKIKGIDINYTPTSARYYLSIVTERNNHIIGNRLPVSGLRWIRAVLINEIIGN